MEIKDNFGADKKEQNAKREDYMNSITADHGPRTATHLSWGTDSYTRERAQYIDAMGNGRNFYMSPELLASFKNYISQGNKIEDINFSIGFKGDDLIMTIPRFKTEHKLRPFD